ncbi:MAG: phosphosulfolactate synthase [Bacteroidales bacterium]|nr:phosphosulfolactate synthase [Bacteroidales bacterium]
MNNVLPFLPERPAKPRHSGLTMVMDKGLSIREAEDFMSVGSEYTDFVKLGFGTSLITPGFDTKIQLYKKAGVTPYFGGTLFEAFIIRDMFSEYIDFLKKYDVELVEVSDGSFDIERNKKLEYISILAKEFTVISEVGSKKANVVYTPDEWVSMMKDELNAGSIKVIAEARESGTTGIYNEDGSINNKIISAISEHVKLENVLWEAPLKSQQAWFIKHFGANVNLGNIAPSEIIPLESLRLGLRGDTFFQFLPEKLKP